MTHKLGIGLASLLAVALASARLIVPYWFVRQMRPPRNKP